MSRKHKSARASYWGSKQSKLRNRTRKIRVTCDWLALDPLCETEREVWCIPTYTQILKAEISKALQRFKEGMGRGNSALAGFAGVFRSVNPGNTPVSVAPHKSSVMLQGDIIHQLLSEYSDLAQ